MRNSNLFSIASLALAMTLTVGCAKKHETASTNPESTTPNVVEKELPGNKLPSDITPLTAHARVENLKVGEALGTDGAVLESVDDFEPGEAIYASLAVGEIGVGSPIEAVWIGPDGQRIDSEIQDVTRGATAIVFKAPNTSLWKEGSYKLEIRIGDEVGGSESFDIGKAG